MKKVGVLVIMLILLSFFAAAKQVETVNTAAKIKSNVQAELLSPENKGKLDLNDMEDEEDLCEADSDCDSDEFCDEGECEDLDEDDETDDDDEDETEDEKRGLEKRKELREISQNKVRNTNQVREAVHALLSIENRTGGIGKDVSAIARNFNNGINKSLKAEEKIQKRSRLRRFFSGGDEEAAEEIETQVEENEQEVEELEDLVEKCDCDEETKTHMKEQVRVMLQENERLQELAQSEKKSKGLFGWLWK